MVSPARFFGEPEPGDIVWCRFPDKFPRPGPKPRPCLVVQTLADSAGNPAVRVAFGTSQKTDQLFAGEFAITPADQSAFEAAGLDRATKFSMKQLKTLPYDDDWFDVAPGAPYGQTPKLGLLHPSLMRRARAAFDAA